MLETELVEHNERVSVRYEGGKLELDGRSVIPKGVSIGKRRTRPIYEGVVALIVILMIGMTAYFLVGHYLLDEGDTRPFLSLDEETVREVYIEEIGATTTAFLFVPDGDNYTDLTTDLAFNGDGGLEPINLPPVENGSAYLYFSFYGDMAALFSREISVLDVIVESELEYSLEGIRMLTLSDELHPSRYEEISFPGEWSTRESSGRTTYRIEIEEDKIQDVIRSQTHSGSSADERSVCMVTVWFGEVPEGGKVGIKLEWGPGYHREDSPLSVPLAVVIIAITGGTMALFYFTMVKEVLTLVVETKEGEILLTGDEGMLRELHYEMAKHLLPELRERDLSSDREKGGGIGVTRGSSMVKGREGRTIRNRLERRVGKSGRMIVHECPQCGNTELYYEGGLISGYVYHCKKCDYVGSFVIEREIDFRD